MSQKVVVFTSVTCVFVLTTVVYMVQVAPPGLTLLYDMSVNKPAGIIQSQAPESNSLTIGQSDWGKEIQTSIGQSDEKREIQKQMDESVSQTPIKKFGKQNNQLDHREWQPINQSNVYKEQSVDDSRTNIQSGNVSKTTTTTTTTTKTTTIQVYLEILIQEETIQPLFCSGPIIT